jgi:hypothetical protein
MQIPTARSPALLVAATIVALVAACGNSSKGHTLPQADGGAVEGGGDTGGPPSLSDGSTGCTTSSQCNGGICCAGSCCTGSSVCLFDQCVTPGAPCHTSNDCNPGQYCEPALGSAGDAGPEAGGPTEAGAGDAAGTEGGSSGDGGSVFPEAGAPCSLPPAVGRCLPLPPTCPDDAGAEGGAAADGGACIEQCTYHPPPGGPLNAVLEWSWGTGSNLGDSPQSMDVWSTPTVGRIYDTNCDGKVDDLDTPVIVFVSGNAEQTCCSCSSDTISSCQNGVIRMLNGQTGEPIWSLAKASASSVGFMGFSLAIGGIVGDGSIQIVAMTGEGYVVVLDRNGTVLRTSDKPYTHIDHTTGWGGGLAIADMDLDGSPEIAYGDTVWTTKGGGLTRSWIGGAGTGGGADQEISTIADVDLAPGGHLELLAGNTCYKDDGTVLWKTMLPDGFPGVADFNKDGKPDAVLVAGGKVWILDAATGTVELGPAALPGTGSGGPPTVADFDSDGFPEIGVAMATFYSVMKPNYSAGTLDVLWKMPNHDLSSSVTGSTVFDFEGAGIPSVIYADECFLWIFDGPTGAVRFAAPHTSFTATEASLLADVDGNGHANLVMVSNGADPSINGWKCMDAMGNPDTINGVTWTPGPAADKGYRGISVFGDASESWVGTRTLWSEHTYHVTNICDDSDNACASPNVYGSIPTPETLNWSLPWLNDFRQNVQDKGIFNAPDAVVALEVACSTPVVAEVSIRNIGQAALPAGVTAGVFVTPGDVQVGIVTTTLALLPGQTQTLPATLTAPATTTATFYAKILIDPNNPKFHECRADNDQSGNVQAACAN